VPLLGHKQEEDMSGAMPDKRRIHKSLKLRDPASSKCLTRLMTKVLIDEKLSTSIPSLLDLLTGNMLR